MFCIFVLIIEFVQAGFQLKTKDHPNGAYTPSELFDALGDIYSYACLLNSISFTY